MSNQEPQGGARLTAASLWPTNMPWSWVSWYKGAFSWSSKGRFRSLLHLPKVGRRQVVCRAWGPPSEMLRVKASKLSIVQLSLHSHYILKSFCHLSSQIPSRMGSYFQSYPHLIHSPRHSKNNLSKKLELKVHQWSLHSVVCLRRFNSLNGMIQSPLTSLRLSLSPQPSCWLTLQFPK